MTSKIIDKSKNTYKLLRGNVSKFHSTYNAAGTGVGCMLAAKGMFRYVHTEKVDGWMITGLAIATTAIISQMTLLRKD
jgi:hypothetical protein